MTPKRLVMVIASILIACSAVVISMYVARLGFVKIVPQAIRFGLTCALSVSLIRGWKPGRWITVVLMGIAGITSIVSGVSGVSEGGSGTGILVLGVTYAVCVIALLTPFAGRHFEMNRGPGTTGAQ